MLDEVRLGSRMDERCLLYVRVGKLENQDSSGMCRLV